MTRTAKLLCDLIALPSVNPAFLPERHPHAGEKRVAEFLASIGAKAGLDIEFQKVFPHRPNLLARLTPTGKIRQRILLAPHLDTVNVVDAGQLTPRKVGDRLYGRGACDTKGSVAAMFEAVCELARARNRPQETEIIFVGLVDEENAQGGSRALAASRMKADLAIVGEFTQLAIATAHKGSVWLEVETRGKAAHGATPQLGKNAVHAMVRVVEAIEVDYGRKLRRKKHPMLGHGTVNVGTIRGGTQPNIVPDQCMISVDRRTLPGETEASARRELETFLRGRKLNARVSNVKLKPCPPLETDATLPLVRQFLRTAGQRRPECVHYFCDAAVLAEGGIPSVVFGPGDIAQAHTADEWVSEKQLDRARDMLLRFLKSLP
ncbi:MAG TPA: M20/M25/M40 family metallo-hydrolase [Verrucomicrobiae bacterium]|nr:M20/M25/M40 family metallo-hydrolase [Verrucomicrobiae bacterium]